MIYEGISAIKFHSRSLESNPLGDPSEREVLVFAPEKPKEGAPLLLGLAGFGGGARNFLNFSPMSYNFTDIIRDLRRNQKLNDAIIAIPDCFTSFGGNQYINSSSVGNYEDFIIDELVPFLRDKYSTGNTGVFGKSSGGFGSYTLAVRHPDAIQGFADHSGDAEFEYCYLPDFPDTIREFQKAGGPYEWYQKYQSSQNKMSREFMKTINVLAMAAFYTPSETTGKLGIEFPFDLETGALDMEVWGRWKELDPAHNISRNLRTLAAMKGIYLDVGGSDEFNINFGMRIMHNVLLRNSVDHVFEEFDGGHFNITHRYEKSLSYLADRLG